MKSSVPFTGTKEQEAQLMAVIETYKNQKGSLIPVMQKAQDIYGYLPIEVQEMIALVRGSYILCPVRPQSQGAVQDLGLSGYRLLCKGLR